MESLKRMTFEELKNRYGSNITYALLHTLMLWENISHGEMEIVEKDGKIEIFIRVDLKGR